LKAVFWISKKVGFMKKVILSMALSLFGLSAQAAVIVTDRN
jgi:hypothetical protein